MLLLTGIVILFVGHGSDVNDYDNEGYRFSDSYGNEALTVIVTV